MRSRAVLVAATASILLLAVPGAAATDTADGDRRGAATSKPHIIELTGSKIDEANLDLGEPGFGPGDRSVRADNLLRNGKVVGDGSVICDTVHVTPGTTPDVPFESATLHCSTMLRLAEGQLAFEGLVDIPLTGPFKLALVGGTGAYRAARGEMKVTETGPREDLLRITLVPDSRNSSHRRLSRRS